MNLKTLLLNYYLISKRIGQQPSVFSCHSAHWLSKAQLTTRLIFSKSEL